MKLMEFQLLAIFMKFLADKSSGHFIEVTVERMEFIFIHERNGKIPRLSRQNRLRRHNSPKPPAQNYHLLLLISSHMDLV